MAAGGPAARFFLDATALWITRIGLLGVVSLHMLAAWLVTLEKLGGAADVGPGGRAAPIHLRVAGHPLGGVVIALFVVYHILHFTFGAVGYGAGQYSSTSVYRNVVVGFSVWYVSAFYIVAQLFLGLHWYHGGWSILHTLGVATAWGTVSISGSGAADRVGRDSWKHLGAGCRSDRPSQVGGCLR